MNNSKICRKQLLLIKKLGKITLCCIIIFFFSFIYYCYSFIYYFLSFSSTNLSLLHSSYSNVKVNGAAGVVTSNILFPQSQAQTQPQPNAAKLKGPVNGDECYFWRTTGCAFGEACKHKHIPNNKGIDRKPWQM